MSRTAGRWAVPALFAFALLSSIIATPAAASCEAVDPLFMLPSDTDCAGWARDGEPRTAYTYEELTEIIDGGAGLFVEYGFVAAAFQNYLGDVAGAVVPATVSLFNQGTAENAHALFDDPNSGMGEPIDDWSGTGEARMRVAFGITTLQFREECFFGSIVVMSEDPAAVGAADCLALSIVTKIQGAVPTRPASWSAIRWAFMGRSR
jgi:hypothetical protein